MILFLAWMIINVAEAKPVTFENAGDTISGHYLLPDKSKPKAVVLFVHTDGCLNYDAHDYYPLIWERLLGQNFAIFSWDKAGVGGSAGPQIYLIGFSQAG
jgi:hypothetical protein